ncbi:Magnesium transporter NIPA [Rhizoctonia solani]|uniref:Magnesium transporter NIPA n=1 Tax=Rhizoctonia solani TaxID=456999 RepID=A0A8H8SYL7_9AGAM|nr:Magnesium transporter NIPA [Rhizoctonia solani]QRW21478.1 Magnesium transporter NIPA [Rhizoctonia solani]
MAANLTASVLDLQQNASSVVPTATAAAAAAATEVAHVQKHAQNPIVAFIIGLCIVTLSSVLNAGGLNLTKLDHVRQNALPKASRQKKDYLRPLWLIGMILYILSQLLGSTLALEYMRAEYVAPLGSTSLIFNFMFASILVGTPVGRTDIYGTVVVVLGVCGIVAFGSINSGLESDMDIARLSALWGRGGWLLFFILMSTALTIVFFCTSILDAVLSARSDLSALPAGSAANRQPAPTTVIGKARFKCISWEYWLRDLLERWTASRDDNMLAWTLGIGWACVGGGLAGGCLVFAKAVVKLISGVLSKENTGNQFGHPAAIITFIFLAITAVSQIIALNKGLKVYDSTLVVPVFYGVYTASGFLNSLVFNDEIDAYQGWTLFAIALSILVLIGGVVLLTTKKPDPNLANHTTTIGVPSRSRAKNSDEESADERETETLHQSTPGERSEPLWQIGEDDEDEGRSAMGATSLSPKINRTRANSGSLRSRSNSYLPPKHEGEEGRGLMGAHDEEDEEDAETPTVGPQRGQSSRKRDSDDDDDDEFGGWERASVTGSPRARR